MALLSHGSNKFGGIQMTQHNVGALVVVKPGEEKTIAGIITERGNKHTFVFNCSIVLSSLACGLCTTERWICSWKAKFSFSVCVS